MACSRISTLLRPLFPSTSKALWSTAQTRYFWYGMGAYRPIDNVEIPKVQEVAKFAITEHNNSRGANLQFERVLEGEEQVVAGKNYKLVLAASSDRKLGKYEAVVYDRPWQNIRRLTSFRFIDLFADVLPDNNQPPQSFPQKGFTLLGQMAHLFDEVQQNIKQLQHMRAYLRQFMEDHDEVINDRSSSHMSSGDDGEVIKGCSSSEMSSTGDDDDTNDFDEIINGHSSSQTSSEDDEDTDTDSDDYDDYD